MSKRGNDTPKDNKWAWKDTLPKEGEPTTKSFAGKEYHVACKYHPKQWVCHSSEECSKNPDNTENDPPSSNKKRLKAAKLAAAILEENDDEEESGEESSENADP
jgi:hypothetical protein